MSDKTPVWERTSVQNLLRHGKSGRYYGRWTITVNGKARQLWRKLNTDVFTVAKLRVNDEAAKIEKLRGSHAAVKNGSGLVGDGILVYAERCKAHPLLKPASITARLVALKKLTKTWPELAFMKWSSVTPGAVSEWATRFQGEGTAFTPPGSKTVIKGNSATSVNRAIDSLRRVMDIGVQSGAIHSNPVVMVPKDGQRLKKKITKKKLTLPSLANVQRLFVAMEANKAPGGWGQEAADFCRFMAFSGCRVGEVSTVTWSCVDWDRKQLEVHGVKSDTSERVVPLFAELEATLRRVQERRRKAAIYSVSGKPTLEPTDKVFRLSECQKTIDSACAAIGIPRITHHDFRHVFATTCIESGVDIPTVSKWLGHADGGALAMKTYGHLRQEHSATMAAKVDFGSPTP